MLTNTSLRARLMVKDDLESMLSWRNHPEVKRFMLTQHEITPDEHWAWFEESSKDQSKALLVIEEHGIPIGTVHFTGVKENGTAEWSFHSAPHSPKGTGYKICTSALQFAFRNLSVNKVSSRVLAFNTASLKLHHRLGFKDEGILREHQLVGNEHIDIYCLGILMGEWLEQQAAQQE